MFSRNFFVVYLWQVSSCSVSYLTLKSASAQKQPTNSTQLSNALLNNIAVRTRDGNACSVLCTMQDFHCFDPRLVFLSCATTVLPFSSSFPTLYLGSPKEATIHICRKSPKSFKKYLGVSFRALIEGFTCYEKTKQISTLKASFFHQHAAWKSINFWTTNQRAEISNLDCFLRTDTMTFKLEVFL